MGKTRVGVILRESIGKKASINKSADLQKLTAGYHMFCKRIHVLIQALKLHLSSLKQMEKSRSEVAKCFAGLTKESPLFDCIGLMPSEDRPASSVCSYSSIHDELGAKTKSYAQKYQQFILDYAIEWEKVVRTRIDNGLKKAEEMRRELDHYQKKVESLRLSTNQAMAKGKSVPAGTQEKLQRNEEKLIASKGNYNTVATDLVILMEEVTERSWRDLHPLLVKVAQFDVTLSGDEAKALSNLNQVVSALKQVANEKGISPQPRLKDLASLKPELISTRPGGVAGLQIEAGNGPFSPGSIGGETALSPGSVGPQGMGGFPVSLSPSGGPPDPSRGVPRSNSITSTQSAPVHSDLTNSMNMLALASNPAPPPTFDDVYSSSYNPSSQSAPTSGNYPVTLPPSSNFSPSYRSASFNDVDSAYSGYSGISAPPAGAPPLPPSMPPPPPPSGYGLPPMGPSSSYGGQTMAFQSSPWSSSSNPPQNQGLDLNSLYGQPPPQQQQQQQQQYQPYQQQQYPPQQNSGYNPFG